MKYLEFIFEHKFWGKTISQFLDWMKSKSDKYFVVLDSETTGLPQDPYEIQLTQVSCIVVKWDFDSNQFKEVGVWDKKIKLSQTTLDLMKSPESRINKVLSFNHYGQRGVKYHDEAETLNELFMFISEFDDPILVIQNAEFDMRYLNMRNPIVKFNNEVLDTKQVLQLFYLPLLKKLAESQDEYKHLVNKIGTSPRDNNIISSSLGKVGPALGINMSGYHDALTDCRLTIEMLRKVIDFLKNNSRIDISKYQAERIKTKR